jgi:hypothetical protein
MLSADGDSRNIQHLIEVKEAMLQAWSGVLAIFTVPSETTTSHSATGAVVRLHGLVERVMDFAPSMMTVQGEEARLFMGRMLGAGSPDSGGVVRLSRAAAFTDGTLCSASGLTPDELTMGLLRPDTLRRSAPSRELFALTKDVIAAMDAAGVDRRYMWIEDVATLARPRLYIEPMSTPAITGEKHLDNLLYKGGLRPVLPISAFQGEEDIVIYQSFSAAGRALGVDPKVLRDRARKLLPKVTDKDAKSPVFMFTSDTLVKTTHLEPVPLSGSWDVTDHGVILPGLPVLKYDCTGSGEGGARLTSPLSSAVEGTVRGLLRWLPAASPK